MYGVILMAALSTAPTTQGHCFRGHGCHGCNGYGTRYTCHGCYGSAYNGAHFNGCHGCYGAWGGGYGAHWGGYHPGSWLTCHGCYGCYGGHSCYGMPGHSAYAEPAPPSGTPAYPPDGSKKLDTKPGKIEQTPPPREKNEQARARITIDVPADAKVYIDDQLMKAESARRTYQTPDLKPGQFYFYDIRAEVVRNGQVVSQSQRVILRPGRESTASFANLGQTAPNAAAQAGE
jgi:uncharacterized protein (TIGR03000 family)